MFATRIRLLLLNNLDNQILLKYNKDTNQNKL